MNENKEDHEKNHLSRLIGVMHDEDLIRFRRRLEKRGFQETATLLTTTIQEREALEKAEHASKKK